MNDDQRIVLEFLAGPVPASPRADTLLVAGAGTLPAAVPGWAGVVVVPAPAPAAFAFRSHGAGCACCTPRDGVAAVLADVFRRRATSDLPWFDRVAVIAPPGQGAAWRAALAGDVLVSARFAPQPDNAG
mgnify:CR=1 FL=1